MRALNRSEINRKSINFWMQFGILVFSTLFVVYFFVWASLQENKKYQDKLRQYNQITNDQILLRYKVDSLYWYVGRMAPGQVSDNMFLASYIREQKESILTIALKDSATWHDNYKKVAERLDRQVQLRDTIISMEAGNTELKRLLEDCKARNKQLGSTIQNLN